MTSVKFGLLDENEFNTNSAIINTFYPINHCEYLATTRSGLFKFEGDVIKKIYPFKFATSIIIPEYKFIVGISSLGGEISVLLIDELENPVFSHFKTDQLNIFHIIYSSRSHSLITVGSGIKVWNFNVKMPRKITLINRPEISITLRAQIAPDYNTPILNPPTIDYNQELLYLPTSNGFCGFDLNGNEKKLFSKVDSTAQTAASLCLENKKFITSSQGDGFHLWNQKGYLVKKIPGGMSSILAIRFINKHFALFLDSNFWVFIIDIKTNNFFHCYTISSKPSYFNVYRDSYTKKYYLIISQGFIAKKLEIILPWTVWKKMTTQPYSIRRCPKFKDAARILTYYKSSIFSFLSPKDGKNLTSAVDTQPSGPIFHYYDRGLFLEPIFDESNSYITRTNVVEIFPENKRDVLFVTTAESNTSLFSTGNNPCQLIKIIEIQVSSITVCEVNGTFMYCFSNSQGELLFYNYSDFSRHSRKLILKKPIKRIFYHRKSGSIIIVFQDEIHRFELSTFKDVQRIPIKDGSYSEFYGNLLLIGCKNGNIDSFRIDFLRGTTNYTLKKMTDDCIHYHDDEVTSFSFSQTFFVSSSLDKTVKIWNYNFNLLFDIIFPFPLFSCEILNAQRDILVGTDNEILKLEGTSLFGNDSIEAEIKEIDNYDKISDELTNQLIQFAVEKNKEEQSDFLSNRNKKKNDEISIQKVSTPKINQRFNESEFNDSPKKQQQQQSNELSEEERNRRLYEMNLINERSDNEKLQAKIRAEMKMKMEEEERKRKLKEEAEEEARRKLMKNEEEEEDKNEKNKERRRKRRKIKNHQIKDDPVKNTDKFDDFDDLFLKPKKQTEKVENNEQPFLRKKAVYKPKQSGPRPSRPFRTNTQKNQDNQDNKNDDEDYYDYEEEENGDVTKNGSEKVDGESVVKNHRRIKRGEKNRKKSNSKDDKSDEITGKNKGKSKNKKKRGKNRGDGFDSDDNNGNEYDNEVVEYEEEEEAINESFNDENSNEKKIERENFDVDLENNEKIEAKNSKNNNKKDENTTNNDTDDIDDNSKSLSKKPLRTEIDTQTMIQFDNNNKDDDMSVESNVKKKGTAATKRKIQQSVHHDGILNEKSKKEQGENQSNSHSNKKRSEITQKSSKSKSNVIEENKDNKEKKNAKEKTNGKENKGNRNEKDANDNNRNISNEKKMKQNTLKGRHKYKREQIFLSERLKRVPTPPPEKKIFYNRNPIKGGNINSKTLNPNKPLLLFRKRNPLRRSRTPPVLDQEKLVLLPGPEIVLDREVIIDKILDGNVELMPLLRRLNKDNRSYYIQKLKQSYYKNNETRPIPQSQPLPPPVHNTEFNFSSFANIENTNQQNTFFKLNSINENKTTSQEDSYPPIQSFEQSSKYHPILPNTQNLNPRKNITQKEDTFQPGIWKSDGTIQNQEIDNQSNKDFLSYRKEKQQKKPQQRQQQVSILNLGFEPQRPVPPLNFQPKREITLPNLHRQVKNSYVSPRRNQQRFQRRLPIFYNNGDDNEDNFTKSSENFSKPKIGPLPQFERAGARHKNNYQKPIFFGMRSSSPPPLYRPNILGKTQNNNNMRNNRNLH